MITYITERQIEEALTMKSALPVFHKAYQDCVNGQIYAGDRVIMAIRGEANSGQWLTANCLNAPYFGAKFSSAFPGNIEKGLPITISQTSLYSAETGELLALLEANYLTMVKTGGSAALATDCMARKDATRLGTIGTGMQAFGLVMGIQEVRELTELYVYDLSPERVNTFVEKVRKIQNRPYKIIAASSAEECVSSVDILSTCTTSHKPTFPASALRPGMHVNAIGSYTPFMQEIEEEAVVKCSKVITEHVDALWEVAGDILIPFEKGMITREKVIGSVGDVLIGKVPGRENDEEITLYESVGSCVLDMAIAVSTYELFANR